ncbi:MAG: HpsJ family protein [Cyanobacteria bacterium J06638_22]
MSYPEEMQDGKVIRAVQQFSARLATSIFPFRYVGYGLMALVLIDWLTILIPPSLFNPVWEFQTFGALVDRAPLLLVAILFVFFGGTQARRNEEGLVLKALSWGCLLLSVLFMLSLPLGIVNTLRINTENTQVLTAQYNQNLAQAEQFEDELRSTSPSELIDLVEQEGIAVDTDDPSSLKDVLLAQVSEEKTALEQDFQRTQASDRRILIKNSVKWNLGALIIAALLFTLWRTTDWARQ